MKSLIFSALLFFIPLHSFAGGVIDGIDGLSGGVDELLRSQPDG